jgi:hypothetical protein
VTAVVDFGWGWRGPGRRFNGLLSWWPDCGAVAVDGRDGVCFLGIVNDEMELRRRLAGWEGVIYQPDALTWAGARVAGRPYHGEVMTGALNRPVTSGERVGPAP